jgi:glycosyltransferase involved in cell wall biosynthesis
MKKLLYITVRTPFGKGEEFILKELETLEDLGIDLLIVPRNPPREIFHPDAVRLLPRTLRIGFLNLRILAGMLAGFIQRPRTVFDITRHIVRHSRNWHIIAKNLAVIPKALYLSRVLGRERFGHIHVHWAGTTSTMAYVLHRLTGIPWSMSVHRWDIREDNMLRLKVESAGFVRCVSEHGRDFLRRVVGNQYDQKLKVIHMGVDCSDVPAPALPATQNFVIVTPANLVPVKGHKYLIEACAILLAKGVRQFRCCFYGEGPLRRELIRYVREKGLKDFIEIPGQIPHAQLIDLYRTQRSHIVVLASINTDDGEHEGIPVSLMEAMAHAIPVVASATGGIPELLGDGSGILVDEKNPEQLADAMLRLMRDAAYYRSLGERGQAKVMGDFEITKCCQDLVRLFGLG